jgi:O-antigen/teichoic acid export membrane protein
MTFFKSFFLRFLSSGLILVMAFANNVLVTRVLGPTGRGHYVLLTTAVMILAMLFGEGNRRANTYLVGREQSRALPLLSNSIAYTVLLGSFLVAVFWGAKGRISFADIGVGQTLLFVTLLVAVSNILFQSLHAIFLGLDRMVEYNVIPIVLCTLYLCGNIFVLKIANYGLSGVMLSSLVASGAASLLAMFYVWKVAGIGLSFDWSLFLSSIQLGSRAMVISLLITLLFRSDIYLVGYFLGSKSTGVYSIAIIFAEMLQKVPNMAGIVLFSKIVSGISEQGDQLTARVSRFVFGITLIAGVGLICVAGFLIPFVFGDCFSGAYLPFVCMFPGVLAMASGSIVNANLWNRGYPRIAVVAPAIALLVNVVLNIVLIPHLGLIGAGLSTSVAYTIWGTFIFTYFIGHSTCSWRDLVLVKSADLRGLCRLC